MSHFLENIIVETNKVQIMVLFGKELCQLLWVMNIIILI